MIATVGGNPSDRSAADTEDGGEQQIGGDGPSGHEQQVATIAE